MTNLSVRSGEGDIGKEFLAAQPVEDAGDVVGVVVPLQGVLVLHGPPQLSSNWRILVIMFRGFYQLCLADLLVSL